MRDKSGKFTKQSDIVRFFTKVNKTSTCWEWQGHKNWKGYGQFWLDGANGMAHRFSYQLANGPIVEGRVIDHTCFNRACVNPGHLREVTVKQNAEHRIGAQTNSRSGVRGVFWHAGQQRWRAKVVHNQKSIFVGSYESKEEAEAAVNIKRLELFTHDDGNSTEGKND